MWAVELALFYLICGGFWAFFRFTTWHQRRRWTTDLLAAIVITGAGGVVWETLHQGRVPFTP